MFLNGAFFIYKSISPGWNSIKFLKQGLNDNQSINY